MLRRIIYFLAAAAIAAALVWALWPKPVPVTAGAIARHNLVATIDEEARTRIREIYTVSAPIAGTMLRSNLHAGDSVTSGRSIVATLRPANPGLLDERSRQVARATADAAAAAVGLADMVLKESAAALKFAQGEHVRATALAKRGTISERAFEKSAFDLAVAEARVASAESALQVRRKESESASAALIESSGAGEGQCCSQVIAPASGVVLRVLAESEQSLAVGAPILEIGDPADLEIEADLLSRDAVRIAPGAKATIEGWGGAPIAARVSKIDPTAFTKVSALGVEEQRVNTVLRFEGDAKQWQRLGHGFRVLVHIESWRGENALAVPISALFRTGEEWSVFAAEEGRAVRRLVKIGERNLSHAELKEGLKEGDKVILHPSDRVTDGVRIAIEE
ncbi:MAG: efflux RND transporter periplasmic adaptor subunit [Aestuariivirga sp.]